MQDRAVSMYSPGAFESISRGWRARIGATHDYSVIKNDAVFRTSFSNSYVLESDYRSGCGYLEALIREYEGKTIEETFGGAEEDTFEGVCYCIHSTEELDCAVPDPAAIRARLLSDLTLVFGIGRQTEMRLRAKGYRTIRDLARSRSYAQEATECLAILESDAVEAIAGLVRRWHSPSHPLSLLTSGLYRNGDLLFLDLETLGLFSRPVILCGIAEIQGKDLVISQYLLRGIHEELGALSSMYQRLEDGAVLVTYNGKSFDIPYLKERFAFYGRPAPIKNPHYDLLHISRRRWKDRFSDCRLMTLEQHLLGVERTEDVPGAMVPEFYETFLATGNPGPLVPIVLHNRQDLVSLARLFLLMREEAHACC